MAQIQHFCKIIVVITCVFSTTSQTNRDDDRQWADGDIAGFCKKVCNEECTMCTEPKKCSEGQTKCGEEPPKEHPDCYPDEICVPKGCNCRTIGKDKTECPLYCPLTCNDDEILCPGGADSNECLQNDQCIKRPLGTDGLLCPGYCPVVCESDEILCSMPNDPVTQCKNAPKCIPKQTDVNGVDCTTQLCPIFCDESEILCDGGKDHIGCNEPDTCVPKDISDTNDYCPGTCPIQCPPHAILCEGHKDCETGCYDSDTCAVKAKDINGDYCPDDSSSHQCQVECCNDFALCIVPITPNGPGCEGKAECISKLNENGTVCPDESVCPKICKMNEVLCPVEETDENGCKKPDICVLEERSLDGGLCSTFCPIKCNDDEILCSGYRDEMGCKGPDSCIKRERKLWGDDKGGLCPGICPKQECKADEIFCASQRDRCDGCPTPESCLPKHVDRNNEYCPDYSASHGCPKICPKLFQIENVREKVLCIPDENEVGCRGEATCENWIEYCPEDWVCPVQCKEDEIQCQGGYDANGCRKPDECFPLGEDKDGFPCYRQCPVTCEETNDLHCDGGALPNGCQGTDFCLHTGEASFGRDIFGNDCPPFCPIIFCPYDEPNNYNSQIRIDEKGCIAPRKCSADENEDTFEDAMFDAPMMDEPMFDDTMLDDNFIINQYSEMLATLPTTKPKEIITPPMPITTPGAATLEVFRTFRTPTASRTIPPAITTPGTTTAPRITTAPTTAAFITTTAAIIPIIPTFASPTVKTTTRYTTASSTMEASTAAASTTTTAMGQFVFTIPKYTGKCQSVDGVTFILDSTNSLTPPEDLDSNISQEEDICMNWCEIEKQKKRKEGIDITGCQFEHDSEGSCKAIIDLVINSGDGNLNYTCWDLPF